MVILNVKNHIYTHSKIYIRKKTRQKKQRNKAKKGITKHTQTKQAVEIQLTALTFFVHTLIYNFMKRTGVQTLGTPTHVRSLAHNNDKH